MQDYNFWKELWNVDGQDNINSITFLQLVQVGMKDAK